MSIFVFLAWLLGILVAACWSVFALEYVWYRYCAWSLQRDCNRFWAELECLIAVKYGRHRVPKEGPYR